MYFSTKIPALLKNTFEYICGYLLYIALLIIKHHTNLMGLQPITYVYVKYPPCVNSCIF